MATQVTLESPSINVYPPDTDLSLELNSEQASSPTQFTVHSVDSSPLGLHSPAHAPTSAFLSQTSQNQSPEHSNSVSHRNSLDSIRNSFNFHRNTQTQEEMIRNKKRHRGKIYRTLTLEESAYHEEYVYSASVDSVRPHGTNPPDEGSSARDILTKRHKYVYIHYLERAVFFGSVVILGVLSVVLLAVGRLVLDPISNEISLPHTTFYPVSGNLVLSRGSKSIRCSLSSASADQIPPVKYDEEGGEGIHLRYNYTDSSLVLSESNRDDGVCTHIFWEATTSETLFTSLELCFSLMEGHWFGGYESYSQQWPLNYNSTQFYKPFLTTDYLGEGQEFGPVLHPAWFSSEGAAVIAETDESYLHVQLMNMSNHETRLCLGASFDGYLLSSSSTPDLHLNVTICLLDNILQANKYFLERVLGSTQNNSVNNNINIFPSPIWSTWEQYRSDVDQDNVLELLNNILSQGFNASIIQIDDTFSSKYGEIDFDTVRFPDVASMIQQIHDQNINVSVWIHPFGNINSDIFQESLSSETSEDTQNRWMFCRGDNHTLGVVRWWRGYGGLIDLTKQTTFDWLLERLTNFSNDYSIDSFKFDAGESTYLPQCDLSLHPNLYSQLYVDLASHFPSSQVQVGYDTQSYPMIVSLLDKEPTWGLNNGLHSVLTSTLTLSILGYPFVLPGSIGGSNYKRDAIANYDLGSDVLDEELFIRWVGLNAFLPFMQFSKLPWQYDDKVRDFSLEMSKLHYKLVQETMDCIGRKFTTNQEPIIRPLWWVWPMDPRTYTINTQFLIGDVYLVAPALSKGQTQCSVYLPANSGSWKDMRDSKTYSTTDESKEIQLSCTKYQTPPYFRNMASEMGCI